MFLTRVVLLGASIAAVAGCATSSREYQEVAVCPWSGAQADEFDGPIDPAAPGYGAPVNASGSRAAMGEVASLLKQASACGWTPDLKSAQQSAEGVRFEIALAR